MKNAYDILVKGGSVCFWGDWFGRPYDNFHRINCAFMENNTLEIFFGEGEMLRIIGLSEIVNETKRFIIKDATQVHWEWNLYGANERKENNHRLIYIKSTNNTWLKTSSEIEKSFIPKEQIAVQILNY